MWIRYVQYLYPAYYYILSVALLLVHHETDTLKSSSMCLNVSTLRWLWITFILQFCVAIHWSEKVLSQTASKSTLILQPAGGEVCWSVAVILERLFSVKKKKKLKSSMRTGYHACVSNVTFWNAQKVSETTARHLGQSDLSILTSPFIRFSSLMSAMTDT